MIDTNLIDNVFSAQDKGTTKVLGEIATAATAAQSAVDKLSSGIMKIAGIAGVGLTSIMGLDKLREVNKSMEDTMNTLAGMLQANDFVKQFSDGLLVAEGAMSQIRKEAAALPGTDVDFLQAFQITFQAMKDVGMTDVHKMVTFSDNMVAVAKAYGVNSQQAARDISLMLGGHAGSDVLLFNKIRGQLGVKSGEEWNKMKQEDRIKKMEGVLEKNRGLLKNFENTWEAISSTTESYVKNLALAFGGPLFESAKKALRSINDLWGENQEKVLSVAGFIATELVTAFEKAANVGERVFGKLRATLAPEGLAGGGGPVSWLNDNFGSLVGGAAALAGGPMGGLMIGGGIKAAMTGTDQFENAFGNLMGVIEPLTTLFQALASTFDVATTQIANGLLILAEPVTQAFSMIVEAASSIATDVVHVIGDALAYGQPVFDMMWVALGDLAVNLGEVAQWLKGPLGQAISWFAGAMVEAVELVGWFVVGIDAAVKMFRKHGVGEATSAHYREELYDIKRRALEEEKRRTAPADVAGAIGERYKKYTDAQERAKAKREEDLARIEKDMTKKKGKKVEMNFHNAKFNIEQKFAEGFDPDRVAVAFARDVKKLAETRLQSGISNLWTPI